MLIENLPETSFDDRVDTKESMKPEPVVNNRASFKSFAIRVGLFVAILITVFAAIAYFKTGAPTKLTSLSTSDQKDQSAKPVENSENKPTSSDDEDDKRARRKSGDMLTDSDGDGKEPPNGDEWRHIQRRNIESGTGIPIIKTQDSDTKSENTDGESKPSTSDDDTLDEREDYEAIRGPDVKGVDPRSTEIGSTRGH
jgi:hypothetical protein